MEIELKDSMFNVQFLIDDIVAAQKVNWLVTTEGPSQSHEHCLICTDIITSADKEHKARSVEETSTKWNDPSGELIIRKSNHYLCWYCYERFIKSDGLTELREMLKSDLK